MKFGKKLRRAEANFNQTVGLELSFISYKNLKKQLKQTLEHFKAYQETSSSIGSGPTLLHSENLYLESAEKFMGMLCQDILEIAWHYDSQVKQCTEEQRFYLQAYAFLNTEAVRKICKKFDKHVIGEDILGSMMKKLQTQNFFVDIQSLGPYEVGALRQVLVGEGFEDETLPWLSTGAWPQKGSAQDFFEASLVNEQWKLKRQEGEWPNGIPDFTVDKDDDDRSIASDISDGRESDGELEPPNNLRRVFTPKRLIGPLQPTQGFMKKEPRVDPSQIAPPHVTPPLPPQRRTPSFDRRVATFSRVQPTQRKFNQQWRPQQQLEQTNFTRQMPTKNWDRPQYRPDQNNFSHHSHQAVSNKADPANSQDDANVGNLIVNYLPNEWSEIELLAMFSPYGEILSARVIRERFSRRSKGFGFVKFTTDQAAEDAIRDLNGEIACGKRIKVAFAKPRKSRAKANLFVSRFPSDWTSVALKRLFAPYGDIVECRVLRTLEGESKRCGFVRFSNEENALQAILALNSSVLPGEKARLRVKVADRERYQQYKQQQY